MKLCLSISLVTLVALLSGCASLHSVSVTSIPDDRSRPVEASRSNQAVLGIHFKNSFVDGLRDDLHEQCPEGRVTGIYTKYETHWYMLVDRRRVTARGFCVSAPEGGRVSLRTEGPAAASPAGSPERTEEVPAAPHGGQPGAAEEVWQ